MDEGFRKAVEDFLVRESSQVITIILHFFRQTLVSEEFSSSINFHPSAWIKSGDYHYFALH